MKSDRSMQNMGHRLIRWGVLLFLLGLVTGLMGPLFANPRMGLSSHLEGLMNGMFLALLGGPLQELIISFGLVSLALAILACCGLILWGLRGEEDPKANKMA